MSPQELIERLEGLGIIDPKILKKIREQVENPDKTVKAKSVLSYLVKKGQMTETQAKQMLKNGGSKSSSKPKSADSPKEYNTGDLTDIRPSLISKGEDDVMEFETVETQPVDPPSIDATIMDQGQFDDNEDVVEVLQHRRADMQRLLDVVEAVDQRGGD